MQGNSWLCRLVVDCLVTSMFYMYLHLPLPPSFLVKGLFHVYPVPSPQLRSSLAVAELEHKRVIQELREQLQKEKARFYVHWNHSPFLQQFLQYCMEWAVSALFCVIQVQQMASAWAIMLHDFRFSRLGLIRCRKLHFWHRRLIALMPSTILRTKNNIL